jgi:hypothetical protein
MDLTPRRNQLFSKIAVIGGLLFIELRTARSASGLQVAFLLKIFVAVYLAAGITPFKDI